MLIWFWTRSGIGSGFKLNKFCKHCLNPLPLPTSLYWTLLLQITCGWLLSSNSQTFQELSQTFSQNFPGLKTGTSDFPNFPKCLKTVWTLKQKKESETEWQCEELNPALLSRHQMTGIKNQLSTELSNLCNFIHSNVSLSSDHYYYMNNFLV